MALGHHNYSFRNQNFVATGRLSPTPNATEKADCCIDDSWEIILPRSDSRLVQYYCHDLLRFLSDAFGICPRLRQTEHWEAFFNNPHHQIFLLTEADVANSKISSAQEAAFHITVTEASVTIVGKTERGTARGVYYIEDHMHLRGQSALVAEEAEHAPLFSPRMTHSGTELDTFPDNFLEACAHAGMDAIIVYAGHPDTHLHGFADPDPLFSDSKWGYCDYNNLVWRAEGYGLDVYIYSHIKCDMYPDAPGAYEYYDASFGKLFRNCPGLKGIIFVGETFEFPSKDPHTTGMRCQLRPRSDPRKPPGWYPCFDYPLLVNTVKNVIRQYNPDADIVFWSYNFGWAPKEDRFALIETLPRDISYLVTFEMWQTIADGEGGEYYIADYSISFTGPSQVFLEEAQKAKEVGLRLYSMSNTGGRTWDIGAAPYIPVPQQWQKRYEALADAKERFGLCGLMENHHYGWLPSFLTLFSKNAFTSDGISNEEMLTRIARRDYAQSYQKALDAWTLFSEGIRHVIACDIDQYGPYRSGPTYPLLFTQKKAELNMPSVPWAWHQSGGIWNPIYPDDIFSDPQNSLMRLRHVTAVATKFEEGITLLAEAAAESGCRKGGEVWKQLAVARFTYCTYRTAKCVMQWNIAKKLLFALTENTHADTYDMFFSALSISERTVRSLAAYMTCLVDKEKENLLMALDCWQTDSSIGFEASMEYVFSDEFYHWKLDIMDESLALLEAYLQENGL